MKLTQFIFIVISFSGMHFLYGCRQNGCTIKHALNFSVTANKNDGSCIFCDSTYSQTAYDSVDLIDNFITSAHYQEAVVRFYFTQNSLLFNDKSCSDDSCTISFSIKNLTNQDIDFPFDISGFGEMNFYYSSIGSVYIHAGERLNRGQIPSIMNPCSYLYDTQINIGSVSITYF